MDGLFHGKSPSKMDDDWGYPHDLGTPHFCTMRGASTVDSGDAAKDGGQLGEAARAARGPGHRSAESLVLAQPDNV